MSASARDRSPGLRFLLAVAVLAAAVARSYAADRSVTVFERLVLSEEFHSEGACFGDIDGDGDQDVVSGPYWYAGPDFRTRHAYASAIPLSIKGYSAYFFCFAGDFNADGRLDILTVGMPGQPGYWHENPGKGEAPWKRHEVLSDVSNESPELLDITGDGREDLVCISRGAFGYAERDRDDPTARWKFTAITPNRGLGAFTHGLGVGDVNGDGRLDLLETNGWWEQTATRGELFRFHRQRFAAAGGAQMFVYDVDGDGDNDIISVLNAHAYGLAWFENLGRGADDADLSFRQHAILTGRPRDNPYGVSISQMHGVAVVDIDGDGVKDIVTGKRYYAHGGGDPGSQELPVLYWFRTIRGKDGVEFEPWLIDPRCGVGTQLTVGDINGDGRPDIVVGNKLGTQVLLNTERRVSEAAYETMRPQRRETRPHAHGTSVFASHVRSTRHREPESERRGFVLPPGFEVQLVAAEPDIAKPLNLAFDTKGRLWVGSTTEYPFAAPAGAEPRDTIKILEDTDGDGDADNITTFADGLNIPMGLYPYRDGVICFSIPDIWFLRDTDGDGKADRREKLYGPFGFERDVHGLLNSFTRGPDGWLYACHGFNNVSTVAGRDGNTLRLRSGNTFRMRLDGSRLEHFGHGQVNPFGLIIDRFGDVFTADCHTRPITLVHRGGWAESFGTPHDGIGFVPPVMEHMHGSTAICGLALAGDGAFPPVYARSAFSGNVATCRINRNTLMRNGSSVRAREEPDFLISDDPWFRPVDLQIGPDGALYVADFYNRIIGHYEVPLDHPGRDRHSGRIWRIVYKGTAERRDVAVGSVAVAPQSGDLTELTPAALVAELASPLTTRARLAADRLVDGFGRVAVQPARAGLSADDASLRARALRVLHRLGAVRDADLDGSAADSDAFVRLHAFRVIEDSPSVSGRALARLVGGLSDRDALVRRAAVAASSRQGAYELARPLLDLYHAKARGDEQLGYAVRLSMRELLRDDDLFRRVGQSELSDDDVDLLAGICLALETPASGEFLIRNLEHLRVDDRAQLAGLLSFAARHVPEESVGKIVRFARETHEWDADYQATLVLSIQKGLSERGVEVSPVVHEWALSLARRFFGDDIDKRTVDSGPVKPIGWRFVPHLDSPNGPDPWEVSTRRRSSDGRSSTRLFSSFPRGEQLTGIYRSEPFALPSRFEFYLAGHDGDPSVPLQKKNLVHLRDAVSHAVLRSQSPPRNDTAQRIVWDTRTEVGRRAYLEVIDGDAAGAYAWLAVGRFSFRGLNPSDLSEKRRKGADLVSRFRLTEMRETMGRLVRSDSCDLDTALTLVRAIEQLSPDSRLAAAAEAATFVGMDPTARHRVFEAVLRKDFAAAVELISVAMKVASAAEQLRLAMQLSTDARTAEILLDLVDSGRASPRLLTRPEVSQGLLLVLGDDARARVQRLVEGLPGEDERIAALIVVRRQSYLEGVGSVLKGAQLFKKSCAACHQVAGVGGKFAPQLDGLGNRGLDRVVEDILAPSRNVDGAFRATTLVTKDGVAQTVLVRHEEGKRLVFIDGKGQEVSVPRDSIAERVPTRLSPMPASFGETLSEEEFRDLLTYLLSLRSS